MFSPRRQRQGQMQAAWLSAALLACGACQDASEPKMLARNVLYTPSQTSTLESGDVQNALDVVAVKLSDVILGTWSVANYGQYASSVLGTVTFAADGTYAVAGEFAAGSFFSGYNPNSTALVTTVAYQAVTNSLLVLTFDMENDGRLTIPVVVVELKPNALTLASFGSASVLTRQCVGQPDAAGCSL